MKKLLLASILLHMVVSGINAQSAMNTINKNPDYKRPDYFKCSIEIVGQPKLGNNFVVKINYTPLVTLKNLKLVSALTPGLRFANNSYKHEMELLPVDSGAAYSNKINLVAYDSGSSNIYITIEGLNEKGKRVKQGFIYKLQIEADKIEINNKPIIIPKIESVTDEEKVNIIRSKAYVDTISKPINLNNEIINDSKVTVTISGHWAYQDIDDGYYYKNSRYVTVKVYEDVALLPDPSIGTSYTDASGNYSVNVSFDGTKTLYVRFICETQAAYVHANVGYDAYYAETTHKSVTSTNSSTWSFGNYYSAGACWAALDDVIDEFQWIYDRTSGWTRSQIEIRWPVGDWPRHVYLLLADWIELCDRSTYYAWDRSTSLHEYGHAVMFKVYNNSLPTGWGPDEHDQSSESSGGFALKEGWAEFMECSVDNTAATWIEDLLCYNLYDIGDMDGNIVEGAIANILWDIFDPSSTSDRDLLSLGFNGSTGSIWATINKKPVDMNQFWTYWFQSYSYAHQMWSIYNHYGIEKDATPPTNPTSFTSSHTQYAWSNDRTVYESWSGAADNLSGVKGYACVWDQNSTTIPTKIINVTPNSTTSPTLTDGQWYFHLITCDSATPGNWSTSTVHIAGYYIDGTAPSLSITAPNGGENWLIGSTKTISWTQSDNNDVTRDSIYYSINGGSTWSLVWGGASATSYSWTIPSASSTQCKVKVIALDAAGNRTEDISDNNFTIYETTPVAPTVTTTLASSIAQTTATSGGNVTADGGASVTARGVCWSTAANPTTTSSHTSDGTGIGVFTSYITSLAPGTTYHIRAYATNSVNTSYGSDLTFTTTTTPPVAPTVTTTAASSITTTTAASGGNVTADGGATVTARGVCWSTASNPTTSNSHTSDDSGIGVFTSYITGLAPGTTYHIRAYATNSVNTSYGSDLTFTTATTSTDPYEPNNVYTNAYHIYYGDSLTGGVIDPDDDYDWFYFDGVAGDTVQITAYAYGTLVGSTLDSYLELYSSDGTTYITGNDDWSSLSSRIEYVLGTSGRYYVKVRSCGYKSNKSTIMIDSKVINSINKEIIVSKDVNNYYHLQLQKVSSAIVVVNQESFEGTWPPTGWDTLCVSGTAGDVVTFWNPITDAAAAHSGSIGAVFDWGYNLNGWLRWKVPDLMTYDNYQLSFWWKSSYYWHVDPYDNGDLFVKVSSNSGATWNTLWTFGDSTLLVNSGAPWPWVSWTWYQSTLDLSAYAHIPNVWIGFQVVANDNADIALDDVMLTGATGVESKPVELTNPAAFALLSNYPNPVKRSTTFSFNLPKSGPYMLKVYNISGGLVYCTSGQGKDGMNNVTWNASKISAGVYFYNLNYGGQSVTKKMVIVK